MLKSILLATVALAAVSSSLAYADDAETVIVTATRIATPQDQIASSVTVVDAAQIEVQQLKSLPDVLQDVPGLNIVRTGGEGGQTSVFTRGTDSNHTKILLDGVDIADPSSPTNNFDLGKLSAADIAKVEVLRGPGSGLYGSDAIGGVINIITKSGDGPLSLTAHAEGGSFDTFNQDATVSGSDDNFHYRFTVDHQHAGDTPVTPASILLPGETAHGDYFDNISGSAKLGYDITDYLDLGLVARTSQVLDRFTSDGFNATTFTGFPAPTQGRLTMQQSDARGTAHLVLGSFDQTLGLAYSSNITNSNDPENGQSYNSGSRAKLDWQGNWAFAQGETLVLGAETARDAMHTPLSAGITINAGYGEVQSSLGNFNNSLSVRYDDNSLFGNKVTYHIAPTYLIEETGTRLKGTFGTGFKAPSLEDLFGPFGHNPNLKPETSTGYDAGFEQDILPGLTGGATWYHNDIKHLIEFDGPPPDFAPINIDKARTQGVEAFLAWTPLDVLKLRADYTYTDARDTTLGARLKRIPQSKVDGNALWQILPKLSADVTVTYVGNAVDFDRVTFLTTTDKSHVTVDLAVNYVMSDRFTLYGRVDNLSDTVYQNPNGFLQPGVGAYAGIKATF